MHRKPCVTVATDEGKEGGKKKKGGQKKREKNWLERVRERESERE